MGLAFEHHLWSAVVVESSEVRKAAEVLKISAALKRRSEGGVWLRHDQFSWPEVWG
jgi:hypothetical protein